MALTARVVAPPPTPPTPPTHQVEYNSEQLDVLAMLFTAVKILHVGGAVQVRRGGVRGKRVDGRCGMRRGGMRGKRAGEREGMRGELVAGRARGGGHELLSLRGMRYSQVTT